MAERRMFAKTIIDSDAFLDLPISAQALYFHLAMRADDEGFINKPRAIMNMIGAKNDDMTLLINKKFVIIFDSGVIVIKHWKIHNYIQPSRLKETKYKFEKASLFLDENSAYSTHPQDCQQSANSLPTECQQDDSKLLTQVRLGEDRLGKDKTDSRSETDTETDFDRFWSVYPKKVGKEAARKAFAKVKVPVDVLIDAVEKQKQGEQWNRDGGRFIPNPSTWLNQGRWDDDVIETTAQETDPQGRNFKVSGDPSKWGRDESFTGAIQDLLSGK